MRFHRCRATAVLSLILPLCLWAVPSQAADHTIVTGPGLSFTPSTLTIDAGDTVTFSNPSQGMHNVRADDNSFRCANGCDGKGGNGDPSTNDWSFSVTFSQPGTVGYHCEIHGAPGAGMFGTITVQGTPPPPPPSAGSLGFTRTGYSAAENAGSVSIAAGRSGGSSGAVSVQYATADGTGVAGTQYRSASGTLSWADGDSSAKTFLVQVLDDGQADGSHTVELSLSRPTGGASLGTSNSVLTITNTDPGTPPPPASPPAAPSGLAATPIDTGDIALAWTLNSTDDTKVHVQSKPLDGSGFTDLPLLPAGSTSMKVSGLAPATGYGFRVRAKSSAGASAFTAETDAATFATPGACAADANTLCLGTGGRFKVTANWVQGGGPQGLGSAIPLAANPSSGLFYFFDPSNIEMLIKVLNACTPPFDDYWVFFAATTNVQFTVTVVDTTSNETRVYFNPLNQAAVPIQDTSAFATCP